MGVPPKKYVEDIPRVQGEVHAKFGPDPSSSLGGEWQQTDRQTDTPFCFIYIDCRIACDFQKSLASSATTQFPYSPPFYLSVFSSSNHSKIHIQFKSAFYFHTELETIIFKTFLSTHIPLLDLTCNQKVLHGMKCKHQKRLCDTRVISVFLQFQFCISKALGNFD